MSYNLDKNKSVEKNIQAIATEQIDRAIAEINDQELDVHDTIHQVRKRGKKIRGLIRLVRNAFPAYKEENAFYRDTAAMLSEVRDSESVIEIFDKLVQRPDCQSEQEAMKPVRNYLEKRQEKLMKEKKVYELLQKTELKLREGKKRIPGWKLEAEGMEAIESGFIKTYKRGIKAMGVAREEASMENYHEWRKRVKYHWYHVRLITPLWEEMFASYGDEVHKLADYLGDDHDLGIFRQVKEEMHEEVLTKHQMNMLNSFLDDYQQELRSNAHLLGSRVYSLKPKWRRQQIESLWPAWKEEGNSHKLNK